MQRALRSHAARAWRLEGADINLIFSALPDVATAQALAPLKTHIQTPIQATIQAPIQTHPPAAWAGASHSAANPPAYHAE